MVRGHAGEPERVVVIATLGAPRRRAGFLRRVRRRAPADPVPAPVLTTRVTLIGAHPFESPAAARRWLAGADTATVVAGAVAALNRVLHAHRIATADPTVREVAAAQALVARLGYGRGDELSAGRWSDARTATLPRPRARRGAAARLDALLGIRDVALAAEELTLRARSDLEAGRTREAALQLGIALDAALAELEAWSARGDVTRHLAALRTEAGPVAAASQRALQGGLDDAHVADVGRALARLEVALAARAAGGGG